MGSGFDPEAARDWLRRQRGPNIDERIATVTPDQAYDKSFSGDMTGTWSLDDPTAYPSIRVTPIEVTSHAMPLPDPIPAGTVIEGEVVLSDEPESFQDQGYFTPVTNVQPKPIPDGYSGEVTGNVHPDVSSGGYQIEAYVVTDQHYLQDTVAVNPDGSWTYQATGASGDYRFRLIDPNGDQVGNEWDNWYEDLKDSQFDIDVYLETDQQYFQETIHCFLTQPDLGYFRWVANGNNGDLWLQLVEESDGSEVGQRWNETINGDGEYPDLRIAGYSVTDVAYLHDTDIARVDGTWTLNVGTGVKLVRVEER